MDISRCIRIFEPEPDDDFVIKRESAIKTLRTQFSRSKDISKLMEIGSGVCEVFHESPAIPDTLATQVEKAIKKHSPSFERDARNLEMSVCAAMAVVQLINSSSNKKARDVLAVALWSAASFLPFCDKPKLEEFRMFAVEVARNHILNAGLEDRARQDVPTLGSSDDEETTCEELEQEIAPIVDALRINAALDREEINLLWWVLGEMSQIFEQPLMSLSPEVRAVTTGVEIGALMRALPTQSHRNLVLRGLDNGAPVSLLGLLEALGENRSMIAGSFKEELLIDDAPLVFPLLSAIRSGKSTGLADDLPRPLSEWGARALLERAVLQIQYKTG